MKKTWLELAVIFFGIEIYIWFIRPDYPHFWIVFAAIVLISCYKNYYFKFQESNHLSQFFIFLTILGLKPRFKSALPVLIFLFLLFIFDLASKFSDQTLNWLFTYFFWALIQQLILQGYFVNRLSAVLRSKHLIAILAGTLFGLVHLPNPILTPITFLGGVIFSIIFLSQRISERNIWFLALIQVLFTFLIVTFVSPDLHHHFKVGPGFYHGWQK